MKRSDSWKASKASRHLREFCLYYHHPRTIAKARAKVKEYLTKKDGTPSKKYYVKWKCEKCGELFEQVDMHHIHAVGKQPDWPYDIEELVGFIRRLLVPVEQWMVLCRPCHLEITHNENKS